MQADLHAPRLPYVLIIYSLPVVFVQTQTNLVVSARSYETVLVQTPGIL